MAELVLFNCEMTFKNDAFEYIDGDFQTFEKEEKKKEEIFKHRMVFFQANNPGLRIRGLVSYRRSINAYDDNVCQQYAFVIP